MGKPRVPRRGLMTGLAAAVTTPTAALDLLEEDGWSSLLCELQVVEVACERAMVALEQAERRFFALPKGMRKHARPEWYQAALRADADAGDAKETIHSKIAARPAPTRVGQALKLRLLAEAYGIRLDTCAKRLIETDDLVAMLILSLADDLGA